VEVRKGGIALMKISDNGHGMDRENALLSLERHATSKLQSSEGLANILTHGFRGEALPSIASVARFRLSTNDDASTPATDINVSGGKILSVEEVARAQGTTMEVKDLFFNVPARRKFLKSESTEYAHVEHVIRLSALGNAHVRYLFKNNGRLLWDLKPTKDRRTRIADLAGQSLMPDLKEVSTYQLGNIQVEGYLLPGKMSRGTGKSQTVFINNRPIDDPVIRGAIRDGYHGHIQQGQFPVVWLWITMPPTDLDVNVHPAKREVRFARPTEVKHALVEAIANTLSPATPREPISPPKFLEPKVSSTTPNLTPTREPETVELKPTLKPATDAPSFRLAQQWSTPDQQELELPPEKEDTQAAEPSKIPFTYLSTFKNRYWLMEDENGLVIIDPKAARARITYEGLKAAYTENTLNSQSLLIPLLLELDGHDQNALKAHLSTLNELGIEITNFGGNTYQVTTLPTLLDITESGDAEQFILGVIDTLETTTAIKSSQARERAIEKLLISIAAQTAKTQTCDIVEDPYLVRDLMTCELPYCTATGKPTMTHMSTSEIAKKFS
ncbi:MAG: DNA mismatch repair endonuclease MutL, partial [Bacteroidota bacterium]